MTLPSFRRLGVMAAIVVAVVVALGSGLAALVHSPPGERLIARMAEDALSRPGTAVVVDDLAIAWPFELSARAIRVADPEGVWLRIRQPRIDWQPLRLLRRVVAVDRLAAERVVVERLPAESEGEAGPEPAGTLPRLRLALESVAAPIVLMPPVLGEEVRLTLRGTAHTTAGGGVVDLRLRAEGGGGARVVGVAGPDFLDLRWYLDVPRAERWAPLLGIEARGRLAASGSVAGRLPHPAVTGSLDVWNGGVAGLGWDELDLSFYAVPGAGAWSASGAMTVAAPRLDGDQAPVPTARLEAVVDVHPGEGLVRIGDARLTAPGVAATLSGTLREWGRQAELTAGLRIDRLASVPTGLPLRGSARVAATVRGDLLEPDLRAVVRATSRDLHTGIPTLDALLGRSPRLLAEMAVDERVRVMGGRIDGAHADATLGGVVWPRLSLSARLALPELSVLSDAVSGSGVVHAWIRGDLDRLSAWGAADVGDLTAGGMPPADGTLAFDFETLTGTPAGTVSADLAVAGEPVEGRARLVLGEPLRIENLAVNSGGARLVGDLAVGEGGPRGQLSATVPRLSRWLPELRGSADARAVFDGDGARVTARGRNLVAAGIELRRATVTAVTDDLETPRIRFEAQGQGPAGELAAAGLAVVEGPRGLVALDRFRLARAGHDLRLTDATRVLWGPDGVIVEPARLAVGPGIIQARGRLVRDRLDGRAVLDGVPLAPAALLAPDLDLAGVVDGTVTVSGSLGDPSVTASLRGRDLAFAAAARAGLGRLEAALDATWSGGRVAGRLTARDGDRLSLAASGQAPLPGDGPVSGQVSVEGDIGRLGQVVALPDQTVSGRIQGRMAVAGSLADPRLDGRVAIADGRYENLDTGTILANLAAQAVIEDRRARVEARATDGRDGTASLDAVVDAGGAEPSWRGEVALKDFRALRGDDIRARVSANLDLSGRGAEGKLAGRAVVERAEVDLGRVGGGGPPTLDVVEVNRPGAPPPEPARESRDEDETGPVTVALAVDLRIDRAFVRGRGLDSEWSGDLAVAGTLADPRLTGRVSPERGRYDLLGRTFRLVPDSTVTFQGGEEINPRLDVAGEAKAGDIVARAEVTGTANEPQLAFTSQPPLPRDEVLSRVLFGTEAGKLTAMQQIQLGQLAARGLTGGGEGFDPVGNVRSLLGLDVLEVGAGEDGEGGPTVSAGKYIGEDTFLRVEQGTQGSGRVTVEQGLGGGFSVTTELGDQSGGGVGLEWRKDY